MGTGMTKETMTNSKGWGEMGVGKSIRRITSWIGVGLGGIEVCFLVLRDYVLCPFFSFFLFFFFFFFISSFLTV
jgi:hypothetical protein